MLKKNEYGNRVAVVGFGCRYPDANNPQEFWSNLVAEKKSFTEFSNEQLLAAGVQPATFNNPNYVRIRGVVEGADLFDAEFFNFTPKEAELLDPQHRLFLECSWHALEDAGIDPFNTGKKISVFGGTGSPYHLAQALGDKQVQKYASGTSIITSNDKDYVTTRVSYKLNLKGASVNVQCACSTSMVAVVMGVDNLLNYQSDVVIAGGVTIEIPEHQGYMYLPGGLESPDGQCRTFDKDAAGTVFSRGGGVVALKRLEDAVEDKDHIYAVILGGSINNDGNRKAGYTAPSVQGQVEVITEAIELSGIDPSTITMVEAHGTSTPVGDPIEVASLSEAFGQYTQDKAYCAIGSVKTNIGHTDVSSGIASLLKTCLSLEHGIIPASLNFNEPNPAINFVDSPFFVNTKTRVWDRRDGAPRRALVNSFGVGGTNACLILEEPPHQGGHESERDYDLLFVSAHHKDSLQAYCEQIRAHLEDHPATNLNALAHTSRTARRAMKYKAAIPFKNKVDLLARLQNGVAPTARAKTSSKELVLMFPGQGNQFVNMGVELYRENPVFRESIDRCAGLLNPLLDMDIREVLYPSENDRERAAGLIGLTYITQPAIFMVSYAVARVFQSYGLKPDALIGHSVGEYVAAVISGIMTLEDALKTVAFRGKLVYELPEGSMLAVLMEEPQLKQILPDELDIAVINSPELVVVSGPTEDIRSFAKRLDKEKVFNKTLQTSHAFHSRMMQACLDRFREFFQGVVLHAPGIPIISTVTGATLSADQAKDHEYWVQHVLEPVRFSDAATQMLSSPSVVFLECGPGQSLESAIKRRLKPADAHAAIATLCEQENSILSMDGAIGKLWCEEITFDYDLRFKSSLCQKVVYPLLPFNRKSHRIDFSSNKKQGAGDENLKKENMSEWFYIPSWKKTAAIDYIRKNDVEPSKLPVRWLVFSNDKFCDAIAHRIREKDGDCTVVRLSDHFQVDGPVVHIRIDEKDDYRKLIDRVATEECQLRIVHAWNFSTSDEPGLSLENITRKLDLGFYSLIYCAQGLIENKNVGPVSLTCLIDDGFRVAGKAEVKPERSLSLGPIRVLFKEHTHVTTKLINLEMATVAADSHERLIDQLIMETERETDETLISYSGNDRWTETFEPVSLTGQIENSAGLLKNQGVYLITGGSGGIGRTLSRAIAEKVKASIIWTGRAILPPRQDWNGLIAREDTDINLKEKLETILQIESLGSTVHYYSADGSDLTAMRRVVATIESTIGAINGVLHSAGIAGGGIILLQKKSETEKVLDPKVRGALVLGEVFKGKSLDFVHLFSSITSIFGEAGRVDYTSANAFLDALCQSRFLSSSAAACSVNWGQWGGVGMAADWNYNKDLGNAGVSATTKQALAARDMCPEIEMRHLPSEGGKELYLVEVNATDHWVLNEHLLSGMPTLVGTTYLAILTKWKTLKSLKGDLVVTGLAMHSPIIIVNNIDRVLQLVFEPTDNGSYGFLFRTRAISKGGHWTDHTSGTVSLSSTPRQEDCIDIPSLIERFPFPPKAERHFMTVQGESGKAPMLQFSGRWDCRENIYIGHDEWLVELELPERFIQDLPGFHIHPAMLDVATTSHFHHMGSVILNKFLPYSYEMVTISRPFTARMYCHARLSSPYEQGERLIHFDFTLYTESGEPALSMKNYSFINVGEIVPERSMESVTLKTARTSVQEDDILPDEGKSVLELLLRQSALPQVVVYTKDLLLDFKESKISYLREKLLAKKQGGQQSATADDRPDIDTPYVMPENEIEKSVATVWTNILGINKLGINDSFNELGGNSLLAIQLISLLGDEFDMDIQANEFVQNPTIRKLSELILTKILDQHDAADIENVLNAELVQP